MKSYSLNRQLSEKIVKFKTFNKITSIISFAPIFNEFTLYNYLKIICIGIILPLFFSCNNNDRDQDGVIDKKDNCPDVYAKTKNGCPLPKEIDNIHFYIETSASMSGYFKKSAEYKTIVSDLTTKIENIIKPIDIWFIADTISKYNKTTEQFSSDIATTQFAVQKSSELHKIISKIAAKNDSNDVSLLVSDCILSFSDKDIKANPEINREEAPNALKNNINNTFDDLKKKGIATSIYAFNSKFYGTYYDYRNGMKIMNGNIRPFYLWVIADKEILSKFNIKLRDISTFKPEKSLHFGMSEEPVTKYDIIPQIERKGKWMKFTDGIMDIEMSKIEPLQFCVVLNLNNLPEYAKEISYLQKNLQVDATGCEVTFEVKDKANVDISKLKSQPQIKLFEKSTHAIIFRVNSMALTEAKLDLLLPLQYDTWYLDWSCMDDKNITDIKGKTFAFEYLIAGVKEAYATKNKNYIEFSINLNK